MKKLYCALAAAALALSANADYYLVGGFNGWNPKDESLKFTEVGDGNYTLEVTTLTSDFKITQGDWTDSKNFASNGSDLVVGQVYTLGAGGGGNIQIKGGQVDNAKLTLNPAAQTLLVTGAEVTVTYKYALHGCFSSSSWADVTLTEKDGKWVNDNVEVSYASASFGIKQINPTTNGQTAWYAADGNATITGAGTYACKVNGTNFTIGAGTYGFSFDPETAVLTVTGEGDDPNPPTPPTPGDKDLYLVGGPAGWSLNEAYKFTQDGNVYTLEVADGLKGNWKIWDGTWVYNFGVGAEQPTSGVTVDSWFDGGDFNTAFSGKTTIVFTLVAGSDVKGSSIPSSITVTSEGVAEPDPMEEWWVSVQGIGNNWEAAGVHPDADGNVSFSNLSLYNEEFKVKVWNGLADAWYSNGEAIELNTPTVVEYNSDINMTLADAQEGVLYVIAYNVLTHELKITEDPNTGVEAIEVSAEAPVYFNLQGVKVANPEHGIYVKVVNGEATKVVL